jgi:hypothetical protein
MAKIAYGWRVLEIEKNVNNALLKAYQRVRFQGAISH